MVHLPDLVYCYALQPPPPPCPRPPDPPSAAATATAATNEPFSPLPCSFFFVDARAVLQGFDDPDLLAAFPGGVSIAASDVVASGAPAVAGDGKDREEKEDEEEARTAASRAQEECALLERAAHYALMMNADLQVWGGRRWSRWGGGDGWR